MEKEDQPMEIDGFEDCLLGTMDRYGLPFPVLCYDLTKVIKKMVKNGMTEEEAYEYYHYNLIGSWVGDGTPVFLSSSVITDENDNHQNLKKLGEKGGDNV